MITDDPPDESIPTYPEWTSEKNIMLSSFFWGYVSLQIFAGQLAKNYGPKLFLTVAIFTCSLFTALVPFFGSWLGSGGVIACRVIQGMCQGFLFPSVHNLLSFWAPLIDRTTIGSFVYAAAPLGNVIAMPITGAIAASTAGWPVVFYLYGAMGMCWTVVWVLTGSDSPSKHKSISPEEKKYIEADLVMEDRKTIPTPWTSIFTSWPFWAILIAHCGQNWGFWTLLTEIPSYMENVLGFKIASNSYLSSLPYFVLWLLSLVMSPLADWLIARQTLTLGKSRKIFNTIGLWVPALALISLIFVESTQKTATIFLLVIAVGFNAGVFSGFNVNHIDISPTHSGTLMGITNSLSNIFGILAPLAVDAFKSMSGYGEEKYRSCSSGSWKWIPPNALQDERSTAPANPSTTEKPLWNIVFGVAAVIYLITGAFYMYGASGVIQSWDHVVSDDENGKKKKQPV
ncbi:hypothetical protein NQ318_004210 [Aromia moschata]|uniref:Major facilitator superfamily (MFS) profile domain-containing protein n=1 Tax=Aromia moschata TaxID=1265417 RepID=A0AAV8Y685_9CUCU|nr:hypothetical protein NQ318_004210 [Aromia moschata]